MHFLSCCWLLLWYCPHHTTIVVPFKEGTVPGLQPQGGFLREQEGLCTLQKQPRENTDIRTHMHTYTCVYYAFMYVHVHKYICIHMHVYMYYACTSTYNIWHKIVNVLCLCTYPHPQPNLLHPIYPVILKKNAGFHFSVWSATASAPGPTNVPKHLLGYRPPFCSNFGWNKMADNAHTRTHNTCSRQTGVEQKMYFYNVYHKHASTNIPQTHCPSEFRKHTSKYFHKCHTQCHQVQTQLWERGPSWQTLLVSWNRGEAVHISCLCPSETEGGRDREIWREGWR